MGLVYNPRGLSGVKTAKPVVARVLHHQTCLGWGPDMSRKPLWSPGKGPDMSGGPDLF
jgi:hypothetical protein